MKYRRFIFLIIVVFLIILATHLLWLALGLATILDISDEADPPDSELKLAIYG